MWLIGAVSEEEIDQIRKQGWQVDRIVKPDEFNQFIDPSNKTPAEPDSEDLALVYVDRDISELLNEWYSGG